MYAADRNLGSYLAECLTDEEMVITTSERDHRVHEKRLERRFPSGEIASIQTFNPLRPQWTASKIIDVSSGGLGIRTNNPLLSGAEIQVHLENAVVYGEVRYSVAED